MKKFVSFSELDLWHKDKNMYVKRYVDGIEDEPNEAMILGKIVHTAIETEGKSEWIKELKEKGFSLIQRRKIRKILDTIIPKHQGEHERVMTAKFGDIGLLGIFDGYDAKERVLIDYKTTKNEFAWTQSRVDTHKQFSFYALIHNLNCFSYLKEIIIYPLNVSTGKVQTFYTVRSRKDITEIKDWVMATVDEIKKAGLWEKRLSKEERIALKTNKLL